MVVGYRYGEEEHLSGGEEVESGDEKGDLEIMTSMQEVGASESESETREDNSWGGESVASMVLDSLNQ